MYLFQLTRRFIGRITKTKICRHNHRFITLRYKIPHLYYNTLPRLMMPSLRKTPALWVLCVTLFTWLRYCKPFLIWHFRDQTFSFWHFYDFWLLVKNTSNHKTNRGSLIQRCCNESWQIVDSGHYLVSIWFGVVALWREYR